MNGHDPWDLLARHQRRDRIAARVWAVTIAVTIAVAVAALTVHFVTWWLR